MKQALKKLTGRRAFLRAGAGLLGAGFWADETLEGAVQNVQRNSSPSALRITDLRVAVLARAPFTCPIIRIDTNQGISGYGEVRDGGSKTYALFLKSRILGENPCNIERIFRKLRQFGGHGRQAGGVVSIEMALWDLVGKVYNVPIWQMLGGKYRDAIRCYCDTPGARNESEFAERLKRRITEQGFTWLKLDVGTQVLRNTPGTITRPGRVEYQREHTFTGIELTDKGVGMMADYVMKVRDIVGWEIPISTDHFGKMGENSIIKLGKAFEKCNLAWMEDCIPWYRTEQLKRITATLDVPICTGEDIYLKEPFEVLCREHAVDIIHPDLSTSGGILETKRIGDMAQEYGIPMALHMAGSPIAVFASVHCAAATENFLVMENHSVDIPWWNDLVEGVEKPICNKGFIKVPDGPGLGITLNEEVVKQHLLEPGYFEPTPEWDKERSQDWIYS
ncbi:MAG TPA: mandelate racemase/muconate lactonizing enzyme family protein [Bryobacteraceae bacterium]|nr:mandelate racemase/muconate lactonizing enzyme family protein [Bryobacteraceae bacterium]HOQ46158.1 mandelate racemase/muconate lactonizing enzyme family protein [Bryobacteraceae bacterium]HPQ17028.1 mandelate racemase/muconate lactonizing enzyme family protein [Bryobacteraceae bacterium]HPU72701.1 mandelate racemase/muconate lactonizing enzyme family protein [Bryobacteraceae bacterium]